MTREAANTLKEPKEKNILKGEEKELHLGLTLDEISNLLSTLTSYEITEFSWERGNEKIKFSRGGVRVSTGFVGETVPSGATPLNFINQATPQSSAIDVNQQPATVTPHLVPSSAKSSSIKEVRSPMVGTFYRRPSVDSEPYVEVGDLVRKGQVLCIVEAMKLMNEIESDVSGRIAEICLEDAQTVEYGEILFRIDTSA